MERIRPEETLMTLSTSLTGSPRGPRRLLGAWLALALFWAAVPAQAAPFTFAQYGTQAAANPLTFTSTPASGGLTVQGGSANVLFSFLNVPGVVVPGSPTGMNISATMTFSATTTAGASAFGPFIDQPFNTGSITFTDNNAADPTPNLLTVTVTSTATTASPNFGYDIAGNTGDTSSTLSGDNSKSGVTVTYSSAFLTFANGQNTFSISLPAMTTPLGINGATGFLNNFLSTSQGTFNASTVISSVPVPTSAVMLLTGMTVPLGMIFTRRKRLPEPVSP
jgi:hypothetical protein